MPDMGKFEGPARVNLPYLDAEAIQTCRQAG
jgi:hypothetical protein